MAASIFANLLIKMLGENFACVLRRFRHVYLVNEHSATRFITGFGWDMTDNEKASLLKPSLICFFCSEIFYRLFRG